MEQWQRNLDEILFNPPEGKESKCKCSYCKETLEFDDPYYELDDEIFCEDCANQWLQEHKNWVSESMAFGGD